MDKYFCRVAVTELAPSVSDDVTWSRRSRCQALIVLGGVGLTCLRVSVFCLFSWCLWISREKVERFRCQLPTLGNPLLKLTSEVVACWWRSVSCLCIHPFLVRYLSIANMQDGVCLVGVCVKVGKVLSLPIVNAEVADRTISSVASYILLWLPSGITPRTR